MIREFNGVEPKFNSDEVFIAETAAIIGDVVLEKNASIWYSAVLRGDESRIFIGENSNIQDNCSLHGTNEYNVCIGKNVTVGHNAIVHGCTIHDNCLIGMGATVLDGAVIGEGSIVGANALVTGKTVIPPNSLVIGSPAKVVKEIDVVESNMEHIKHYVALSKKY
ncbi:MAG: gamma carbonic anhydrase family protein [Lachnospirales bacterium]